MSRLIDAEALEKSLHDLMERRGVRSWMSQVFDATDFEILIDEAETVEAESAKRGEWMVSESPAHLATIKCSECGTMYQRRWKAYCNFCPNCGAKMKVKEDE